MAQQELQTRVRSVLEDPSSRAVARVYAHAFVDAAEAVGVDAALEEFASFLNDVLAVYPDFEAILLSGIVGRDEKIAIIDRVIAGHASELFTNFLRVLARHDRLDILPLVLSEGTGLHLARTGRKRVSVTSASPLSASLLDLIGNRLNAVFSFKPILEPKVDPSLLGGLVIQVDDTVYDSSLRTRLKQLRDRLRQRSLHEIQSGRNRFSHPEGD